MGGTAPPLQTRRSRGGLPFCLLGPVRVAVLEPEDVHPVLERASSRSPAAIRTEIQRIKSVSPDAFMPEVVLHDVEVVPSREAVGGNDRART